MAYSGSCKTSVFSKQQFQGFPVSGITFFKAYERPKNDHPNFAILNLHYQSIIVDEVRIAEYS
jgi:hypothetical protein